MRIDIDAESIGKAAAIDIGLVGDARATLQALIDQLTDMSESNINPDWLGSLKKVQQTYHDSVATVANAKVVGGGSVLNEAIVARTISELIPEDAITVIDGGQAMMWGTTFIQADDPNRILADPGMGHLGFGLPFANASKLAHPDRPVICVTGDGALGWPAAAQEKGEDRPTKHDDHEGIDDISGAHFRRHAFQRGHQRPGQPGKAATVSECHAVNLVAVDTEAAGHFAVLGNGA